MVWWGDLKGRWETRDTLGFNTPATEWILVVSIASVRDNGGSMEGILEASMDFPEPGGPISSMLWHPAAAISIAFFAVSCPFTSA